MEQTQQGCHRRSVLAGLALGMSPVDFAVASFARASIRSAPQHEGVLWEKARR
jgi:hypothetical protein